MKRIINLISATVLLVSCCGCGGGSSDRTDAGRQSVYVTTARSNNSESTRSYTSSVEENKSVNAGFKTGGQIRRLTVNEGDYVKKGQVIGYLDDDDYRLSVRQLEAQYNQLSSELKRFDEMYRRNNVAPNDYEKAHAGFEQLRTQLEMARNKLAYTRLEAPASGYIVERFMEEGEMTGAGTPVYKIIDNSGLETSVALPSSAYSQRDRIRGCSARSALSDTEIPLDIIGFVPDADNNSLFRLRLRIPSAMSGTLMPGMNLSVTLRFDGDDNRADCVVPSRSIFERNGKEYVWLVNPADSTISAREICRIGPHSGSYSEVNGLQGNELIVAAGVHHLSDGEKVTVIGDINTLND